jgi:hypothetical protein
MRYFATADDKESGKVKDVTQGMTEVEEQIMGKETLERILLPTNITKPSMYDNS